MKKVFVLLLLLIVSVGRMGAVDVWVEAESFMRKGGWVVDQQFMDQMGSPYLLAHGMGKPVEDAMTSVEFPNKGIYHIFVRTYNWTSPWKKAKGPGKFTLRVDGMKLPVIAGDEGDRWMWQYIGKVEIKKSSARVSLHDLTGFEGRCDALYFSTEKITPPAGGEALKEFRRIKTGLAKKTVPQKQFDFVVTGGGLAGMCAAVAAARQGLKVALINDRPVLGGNNSSEIRVHLGGHIELEPYKNLGNMIKEFGPVKEGNAQPADYYMDEKKQQWIDMEKNITLYSNTHVIGVRMNGNNIDAIIGKNIETGDEIMFKAPLFSDCTGDGSVGAWAGADFRMGREAKSEFNEARGVDKADKMTMGASVQWYSKEVKLPSRFPVFEYGLQFNDVNKQSVTMGEWNWETGMNKNQITEFEQIRDYGLLVVYSNWSFLKNHSAQKSEYANRELEWVAYISGKRESRRLMGDYILNENDLKDRRVYEDGTACTSWTVDLHFPDTVNGKHFSGKEFLSTAVHARIYPYPVPYRCLYSRNIDNLFMAGRNISVTHVALATVRVMRTGGMLGEVVGLAASVCKKYNVKPRAVYQVYFDELKQLMEKGAGKHGLENNQRYNVGATLMKKNK